MNFVTLDTLAIIAIPNSIIPTFLCQKIKNYNDSIQEFKVIRTPFPNQYTVIIKFTSVKPAQNFFYQFFGEKLSEFNEENLFFIKEVKNIEIPQDYENSSDSDECPEIILKREISEEDKEQFFFLQDKLTKSPQKH